MKHRISLQKSTGKLIEYQSGGIDNNINLLNIPKEKRSKYIESIIKGRFESLRQNAINRGYSKDDIEVKEVEDKEWETIKKEQIDKPIEEEKKIRDLDLKKKKDLIKKKLNLSDDDFKILKEIL